MQNQRKLRRRLRVAQAHLNDSLAARPCGECTACCTVLGVEEIEKPIGTPCQHLCSSGCGIYAERPPSCKTFECLWRVGLGTLSERPDKIGIVFDAAQTRPGMPPLVVAREVVPGAFEAAFPTLRRLGEQHVIALISENRPRRIIGPEPLVARAWASVQAMHTKDQ